MDGTGGHSNIKYRPIVDLCGRIVRVDGGA